MYLVAKQEVLSMYKKDDWVDRTRLSKWYINTCLDVGYDPFFIFEILDYYHYLLTDPRTEECSKYIVYKIRYCCLGKKKQKKNQRELDGIHQDLEQLALQTVNKF